MKKFTPEEDKMLLELRKEKMSYRDMVSLFDGRSAQALSQRYYNLTHSNEDPEREVLQPATQKQKTLDDFTPREIIKHLYDLGYRIEDDRIVLVQKTVIKIGDIINSK